MSNRTEPVSSAPRLSRAVDGRVLGGVCAGLDGVRGLGVQVWRAVFLLAALCGGIGVILYAACWLVIPDEHETADAEGVRGVVLLAWASGALIAMVLAAGLSAVITVFGLGWVVLGLAAVVLALGLSPIGRRVPGFAVLAVIGALALPAVAVALSPVRISLQDGSTISRPMSAVSVEDTVFHSGFGTALVDLRKTRLPVSGTVTMRIRAGIRRTIVALPSDICVHVQVHYAIHPFASQLATLVSGRQAPPFAGVVLFGDLYGLAPNPRQGVVHSRGTASGPTLNIDFSSQGGSLYVRDYPDDVHADAEPDWPGYEGPPEPRPYIADEPHKVRQQMLAHWHQRRRQEIANQQLIRELLPGPCAR